MAPPIYIKEKVVRDESTRLKIIIVGAGLGGLGAAIACLLAGHDVDVLESATQIGEVGAGIQILPNSCRVLTHWGLKEALEQYATRPKQVNMLGWKGNIISSMNFHEAAAEQYPGTSFWDFHRANLHMCLYNRTVELGGKVYVNSRVEDVRINDGGSTATAVLKNGTEHTADLIVGADGIFSTMREIMVGHPDPPTPTGDLAYRLLLSTKEMLKDPELASFVTDPQVNYWMGPDKHAVNYVLRGGELFNMVLLVPDDMPDGVTNITADVNEMCALFQDGWDPRIPKLLKLCESVQKWKLCIRLGMDQWSHPSGAVTMLGDAVHATLPYLASGAGMSLEDAAVLGECLSRITDKSPASKQNALSVYEECRAPRTKMVVQRGNLQQWLYHLHDGPDQEDRDRKMRMIPSPAGEALAWRDPDLAPRLLGYDHLADVDAHWSKEGSSTLARL
ncbi:putative fad dependent oxidoreductase [Phaeomoniella chlamydospora]|uniref:Putative fad dependent oxidoreductase n=1 Tax=Phaeomoniella chlamydospora TaxID=158046 RepID=A0A0G2GSF3_PHACM|nr:putative fad dependent oxidoreductase [Phaeomoniella chlamydospora]